MIYFIRSRSGGSIKIGTTVRLSERLKQLVSEAGDDIEVLAVTNGSFSEENALHQRFAHLRQHGEWFEPGDDLLGFIVHEARPWDGSDEAPCMAVAKVRKRIISHAKQVAEHRGLELWEYMEGILLPTIEKDYHQMGVEIARRPKRGSKKTPMPEASPSPSPD